MGEFTGKIVVVTGGSKGIGESIVRRFCEAGAHCVIVSRHLDECQALADELKAAGMTASAFACDVSKVAQIKNLVADTVKQFGCIDVLINSAGVVRRKYAVEYTEEDWDFIMDINLKGAYFCSVEVGKQMIQQKSGAIVSLASLQNHINTKRSSIYGCSKAGIRNFTRGLANEWADYGIRVNCVSPGFIVTPLTENIMDNPAYTDMITSRTPLGRAGKPDEVADAVLFLASSKASYITGADLCINGGWTAS